MPMIENQAFESLRQAFETSHVSTDQRKELLRRIQLWIADHESEIYDALHSDLHKPKLEAYLSEIYFTQAGIKHCLQHLDTWAKPKKVSSSISNFPSKNWVQPTPKGVVLIIAPWNYPFHLSLAPLIEAISAGNRIILKPSELAPHTSHLLHNMFSNHFFDSFVRVVEGGKETTENLLKLPFDHIFFTGGTAVGKIVAQEAAKNLSPVTLELGGKNPCIVDSTANLELSVKRILNAKFFNSGQTCLAPDFVWVDRSIQREFVELSKTMLSRFYPSVEEWKQDTARIINQRHFDRLMNMISPQDWALHPHSSSELRIAPTLIENPSWNHPALQEEIFGPILPIVSFDSHEDVIRRIRTSTPLALYVFSSDQRVQKKYLDQTRSGGVCFNDCMKQFTNHRMPFGGVGQSGYGAYHGSFGFEAFSHMRSVALRGFWWDKFSAYPPYKKIFSTIRKFVK